MCGPLFLKNQESCGPGSRFDQFWAQESNILAVQADFGNSESPKILKVKQAVERQFAVCRRVSGCIGGIVQICVVGLKPAER